MAFGSPSNSGYWFVVKCCSRAFFNERSGDCGGGCAGFDEPVRSPSYDSVNQLVGGLRGWRWPKNRRWLYVALLPGENRSNGDTEKRHLVTTWRKLVEFVRNHSWTHGPKPNRGLPRGFSLAGGRPRVRL